MSSVWKQPADLKLAVVKEVRFDWGVPRWFITKLTTNTAFTEHVQKLHATSAKSLQR